MTNRLRAWAARVGAALATWLSEMTDWLPVTLLIGAGPGLALSIVRERNIGFGRDQNRAEDLASLWNAGARTLALVLLFTSMALWLTGCVIAVGVQRRKPAAPSHRDLFVDLNRRWLPISTLPIVAYLLFNRTSPRLDYVDLSLTAVLTAVLAYWCYRSAGSGRFSWASRIAPKSASGAITALSLLVVAYCGWASYTSIIDHWNMGTRIFDLGIYDNTVFNSSQGRWLECTFSRNRTHASSHFDPILILFAPAYWIYPHAETLLVLQSVLLGLGAVPLYLYSRHQGLAYGEALVIAACYLLMPALHGINLFDFHSLALMVPLTLFSLLFLETRQWRLYALSIALLLLVREDQALIVVTIGLYALATRQARCGILSILGAGVYAVLAHYITSQMIGAGGARTYEYYYGEVMAPGKSGAVGLLYSILSNPLLALATALKPTKIFYFLKLLLPLCFLPLLGGKKLWLLAYGVAFIGLATRNAVSTVHYQYSALILPFVMLAAIDGLKRLLSSKALSRLELPKRSVRLACFCAVLTASLATSLSFGAWPSNPSFYSGRLPLQRRFNAKSAARHNLLKKLIKDIPAEAALCTDPTMGPHVSNRQFVSTWPRCRNADYIFLYKGRLSKPERAALANLPSLGRELYEDSQFALYQANGTIPPRGEPVLESPPDTEPDPDKQQLPSIQ